MVQSAAFFDFDRTLLHGDAGVIFGKTLARWGYDKGRDLPPAERRRYNAQVTAQIVQMVGKAAAYRSLNAVGIISRSRLVEMSYSFLEGFPATEMSERMGTVWEDKIKARLYPEMRRVLEDHRDQGHRIVIVTTGLRELVEHSRGVLGHDIEIIGAEMRQSHGVWEGKVDGPLHGVHKAEAVHEYATKNDIDLGKSWAYSDHFSDVAFLAVAGHPVAINPGLKLRLHAKRHGWQVRNVLPPHKTPLEQRDD